MDGRVKKYTNQICRDNQIHYISLRLLFLFIMHLLMSIYSCYPYSSEQSLLIQSLLLVTLFPIHIIYSYSKPIVEMYSGCINLVCVLLDHATFFNCYYTCFCYFFIALSIIHQCHVTWFAHLTRNGPVYLSRRWEVQKFAHVWKSVATPLTFLCLGWLTNKLLNSLQDFSVPFREKF